MGKIFKIRAEDHDDELSKLLSDGRSVNWKVVGSANCPQIQQDFFLLGKFAKENHIHALREIAQINDVAQNNTAQDKSSG